MTAPAAPLRVSLSRLHDPAVESAWVRMQAEGCVPTPFLTWEWYSALRDVPEVSAGIEVLVVRAADRVVGLFPIEVRPWGALRALGVAAAHWTSPDHVDVIASQADRLPVAHSALDALAERRDWDLLDLDGLAGAGALRSAAGHGFGGPRFVIRPEIAVPVGFVPLDEGMVSGHARKQLRKELRRAEASGGGFEVVTEPALFPPLLDELMRLHVLRFGATSRVFATEARRRFHRLAAVRLGQAGMVRLHRLTTGGAPAALTYGLVWDRRVLFYSGGLRTDIGLTPGFSIRVAAMLAAAEAGFAEVDLLRGEHGYKDRFNRVVRMDARRHVLRLGPRLAAEGVVRLGRRAASRIAGERRSVMTSKTDR